MTRINWTSDIITWIINIYTFVVYGKSNMTNFLYNNGQLVGFNNVFIYMYITIITEKTSYVVILFSA